MKVFQSIKVFQGKHVAVASERIEHIVAAGKGFAHGSKWW